MIARNGISGLVMRAAIIGIAAIIFGCASRPAASLEAITPVTAQQRRPASYHSFAFFASATGSQAEPHLA